MRRMTSRKPPLGRGRSTRSVPTARRRGNARGRYSRMRVILWGIGVMVLGIGALFGFQQAKPVLASWTSIQQVTISGLERLERKAILSRLELPVEATLLTVDADRMQTRLEAHPWIAKASVGRILPHTLTVRITERHPAGVLGSGGGALLLDEEGVVLPGPAPSPQTDLPLLSGLKPGNLIEGDPSSRQRAREGILVAKLLMERFEARPEVDLGDAYQFVAKVRGLRFQFGTSFEEQWKRYRMLESSVQNEVKTGDIDLRFPKKVIFRQRG